MKLLRRPHREPLPADHSARVVAHYLTLTLFLATLTVVALTPPEPDPPPATAAQEPEGKEGLWDRVLELAGKLL